MKCSDTTISRGSLKMTIVLPQKVFTSECRTKLFWALRNDEHCIISCSNVDISWDLPVGEFYDEKQDKVHEMQVHHTCVQMNPEVVGTGYISVRCLGGRPVDFAVLQAHLLDKGDYLRNLWGARFPDDCNHAVSPGQQSCV